MKNYFFILFLFLSTSLFAQEDTIYKKVFDNVEKECDSLSDIRLCYLNVFKYVINQKIVEELEKENILSDFLGKSIYLEIEVDSIGKFRILKTKSNSNRIDKIIVDLVAKLPAIKPFKNITHSNENLNAILDFKLKKYMIRLKKDNDVVFNESKKESRKEMLILPKFPNCEKLNTNAESLKKCFEANINSHVVENFKYPKKALNNNIDGKTMTFFVITKEGHVENFISIGANFMLLKESIRIMKLLPKFTPAKLADEPVGVSYTQPLIFKIH